MLRKIKLYGHLAKAVGRRTLEAHVASAAEAVRFLLANFPHLESLMVESHYKVSAGDHSLSYDELHDPSGQSFISFVPVVQGAGEGFGTILAGIALVALSFVSFGVGTAFAGIGGSTVLGGTAAAGFGSTALFMVGSTLLLGGIGQLLSPTPMTPTGNGSAKDPKASYSFNGIQNTSRQGTPVPVIYGETIVGSITISAGVDTVDL
jgi:predicted phage tail protein